MFVYSMNFGIRVGDVFLKPRDKHNADRIAHIDDSTFIEPAVALHATNVSPDTTMDFYEDHGDTKKRSILIRALFKILPGNIVAKYDSAKIKTEAVQFRSNETTFLLP